MFNNGNTFRTMFLLSAKGYTIVAISEHLKISIVI